MLIVAPEVEPLLRKVGLPVLLQQTVRISGRIGRVLLLGGTAPLPDPIARWRGEAAAAGLINDHLVTCFRHAEV